MMAEEIVLTPAPAEPSTRRWLALRVVLRLVVPTVLFGWYHSFRYLSPTATPRMLVGDDWTMYLVSPNYLRTSPLVSLPVAKLPDYLWPVGSNLGRTDSLPILTPLYRLTIAAFPDRPIQLVGLTLLAGVILTFNAVTSFLDKVAFPGRPLERELMILMMGAIAVVSPFWNLQYNHPALMQAWIVVWVVSGALQRCPTALGGMVRQTDRRWTGVGSVCAAAAVQPYFVPMVLLAAFAPDVARARTEWRWLLKKLAATAGLVAVIGVVLGYLGSSGKLGGAGFGEYAADLSALFDPNDRSRLVRDITTAPGAIGGYAYLGLGGILLLVAALVVSRREHRRAGPAPLTGPALPATFLYGAIFLTTVFAIIPSIRIADHEIMDLQLVTDHLDSLTGLFRTNGRFIWPLAWFVLLVAGAVLLRMRRTDLATAIVAGCLLVQVVDVIPYPPLLRPANAVEYDEALAALRAEQRAGGATIQFQPPVVIPGCYAGSPTFAEMGDVMLAASVLELPLGSGYSTREDPRTVEELCTADADAFVAQRFDPSVIYVLPTGAAVPSGLTCGPVTSRFVACRVGAAS